MPCNGGGCAHLINQHSWMRYTKAFPVPLVKLLTSLCQANLSRCRELSNNCKAHNVEIQEKLKRTPPSYQVELKNKIVSTKKLFKQGKSRVEGLVNFPFLGKHGESQIIEKKQLLSSLQLVACKEAMMEISSLH
jgi:hypothetical protein